jgi:nitroreductase
MAAASLFGSILPAACCFMLALRSRGLGSTWTTLHLAKEAEVAKLLGIPPDYVQVARSTNGPASTAEASPTQPNGG